MAGQSILIVDCDADGRLPMIQALRGAGLRVLTADDAVSAVSVALREAPSVIVLDLRLPGGGGYQLLERLQTLPRTAATPVIVCTAEDPAANKARALAAGAVEYLHKPVGADELLSAVRFVLGPSGVSLAERDREGPPVVLVVDDDPDVRRTLLLLFKAQGYEVVTAEDAISAVSTARARRPDVVVLDVGLPGGEGFVVMERLRAVPDLAATPVVVISGREPEAMRRRAERAGAAAFLHKPVDNRTLLDAVRGALRTGQ